MQKLFDTKTVHSKVIIRNVELWLEDGVRHGVDVLVDNGILFDVIAAGSEIPASFKSSDYRQIDADKLALLPAGIDPQVHLRVPGQPEKETAETGIAAAVRGGIAAILTMPNTKPVIDNEDVCKLALNELEKAQDEYGVRVLLSAAITKGQRGTEPVDFLKLQNFVHAFTDDGLGVQRDEMMVEAFKYSASSGLPILQHAEVPGHGCVLAAGPTQEALHLDPYPESAEVDMVKRDIELLRKYPKARYHVLHVSSARTVALVNKAKAEGLHVSCEVSPHHLYFSADDIDLKAGNSAFKMNPPLRSAKDRDALQASLQCGEIDFVATDHAPHETSAKTSNFKTAAFGTTGLETSLRVLLDLWSCKRLSETRLVKAFSSEPARFLGLDQEGYGSFTIGKPFRAVLIDPHSPPKPIDSQMLQSKSKNNCFIGTALAGNIIATFIGDKVFEFGNGQNLKS